MSASEFSIGSEYLENYIQNVLSEASFSEQKLFDKAVVTVQAGLVNLLSRSSNQFTFSVEDEHLDQKVTINLPNLGEISGSNNIQISCSCRSQKFCLHKFASLVEAQTILAVEHLKDNDFQDVGKQYTREGMIERVLAERGIKARNDGLSFISGTNLFGPHVVLGSKAEKYEITFHNLKNETGYCSCPDFNSNKLGTCKHLMFAYLQTKEANFDTSALSLVYPFVDIFVNPINHQEIHWYYPDRLDTETVSYLSKHFNHENIIPLTDNLDLSKLISEAQNLKNLLVRKEVVHWQQKHADQQLLARLFSSIHVKYDALKVELYPYQQKGIEFIASKSGAILADEMGLGKTIQAIGAATIKHQVLGFKKTLIICPASLKSQWLSEINRFTDAEAIIVDGFPAERNEKYQNKNASFFIINYETVLRDLAVINKSDFDFVILDEAQRIKNYQTLISNAIRKIRRKHSLALTGTPLENKLIDLYPIVEFVAPGILSPLWEFSYQHCYFDDQNQLRINGYFNLIELKKRLGEVILRRTKIQVLDEINQIHQIDIPIKMHPVQRELHASAASNVAGILRKKYRTAFDMQRLTGQLQVMRMACDSSFLVDKETHISPKMAELENILFEQFNLKAEQKKVIIFSEWKQMLQIISHMLSANGITHVTLSGKVPVNKRHLLLKEFSENPDCKVFLSTEAGGSGLNLQAADTVINFELPWNPAKKNQRIGRIDRIGQKNKHLTVINFITRDSIEMSIASGLLVKQNLFESVLDDNIVVDDVDFSSKGKAQFLRELEMAIDSFESAAFATELEEIQTELELKPASDGLETEEDYEEVGAAKGNTDNHPSEIIQSEAGEKEKNMAQMEEVMNAGMTFLAGMFKMATGKEMAGSNNKVEIDKETGEVVFRFKI